MRPSRTLVPDQVARGAAADGVRAGQSDESDYPSAFEPLPVAAVHPPQRSHRRRAAVVALVVLVGVSLVVVARLPWEWSLIDDSGLVDLVGARVSDKGAVGGFTSSVGDLYRTDVDWGLFRPAYWVYVAAFYQLPVGPAHAGRVAMLLCAFAGAVAAVVNGAIGSRRIALGVWTMLAIAANGSLFMGVWYPSLQELSALCFVGLGLLARRRTWLLVACWVVAAWFKSPFAWLLFAYGLLLCRRRATRLAGAENLVRAGHAARSYSWRTPPRRSRRRMSSLVIVSGSVIGLGSGCSGRAFEIPRCGRWALWCSSYSCRAYSR
jgi:hypothetical protein